MRKIFFLVMCVCFFQIVEARQVDGINIDGKLKLSGEVVWVLVEYVNGRDGVIYISPRDFVVDVFDESGNELSYGGRMFKYPPLKLSDYVKVDAGGRYIRKMNLSDHYKFVPRQNYVVRVPIGYGDPVNGSYSDGGVVELKFKYAGE